MTKRYHECGAHARSGLVGLQTSVVFAASNPGSGRRTGGVKADYGRGGL